MKTPVWQRGWLTLLPCGVLCWDCSLSWKKLNWISQKPGRFSCFRLCVVDLGLVTKGGNDNKLWLTAPVWLGALSKGRRPAQVGYDSLVFMLKWSTVIQKLSLPVGDVEGFLFPLVLHIITQDDTDIFEIQSQWSCLDFTWVGSWESYTSV